MTNRSLPTAPGRLALVLALAGLALGFAGCGKEEKAAPVASATSTAGEPRGEPIRGEPIGSAPTTTVGVATVATNGVVGGAAAGTGASAGTGSTNVAGSEAALDPEAGKSAANPRPVGFDKLASFQYTLPDGPVDTNVVAKSQADQQIPSPIKSLNNQFVSLKGFMLPLKVEKGLVTELLIMRDQSMCCYGSVPRINEWVSVKMVGDGVKPIMDQAVTLFGKLKVGEMYENGYLVGIYAMDGERMAGPLDL